MKRIIFIFTLGFIFCSLCVRGQINETEAKLLDCLKIETQDSIGYYFDEKKECAIISTYFALIKSSKDVSILEVKKRFEPYMLGDFYSFLDISTILLGYGLESKCFLFEKKSEIFSYGFNKCIIHLKDKNISSGGHFTFCFRGREGKLWIADPAFGNKCIEFAPESEIFKSFSGIILNIVNSKEIELK